MKQTLEIRLGEIREAASQSTEAALGQVSELAKEFPEAPEVLELQADLSLANGNVIESLKCLDRIVELGLASATVWQKLADQLSSLKEFAQSLGAYEESLKLDPQNAAAHHDYGKALYRLGDVNGAVNHWETAAQLCDEMIPWTSLSSVAPACPKFDHAKVKSIRHRYAKRLESEFRSLADWSASPRQIGQGIRVGYLSSWFHHENYMKPVWALINHHDRSSFQINLFTDSSANKLPGYKRHHQDRIHEIGKLSNVELVQYLRDQNLDLLIDLNAFSEVERLEIFNVPLARLTAAWFNMFGTSGFRGFDYLIGDEVVVRPEEEQWYTEKIVRLPQSYLSFTITHDAPPIVTPPCQQNGFLTFGSLVTQYKINSSVIDSWAKILIAVPDSRFLLGNADLDSTCNRDYIATQFSMRGIDVSRIEFRGRAPHREFVEYYNSMDVSLDAFPYNGGTTTMEAIWQGVPVITFDGDRWASRTSASILKGTPGESFVGNSIDDYVKKAVELANNPDCFEFLTELRATMRDNLLKSPVCNAKSLATAMEDLYQRLLRIEQPS